MASGLLALLDDVAALVKVSAASLDDISTQVAKTTGKVSGIVIDDAAVTPKYVVGLSPDRELSIIFSIAKKSMINKLLFLTPIALLLGYFLPWLITPILMIGGAYLCYEGYEKIHSIFFPHAEIKDETALQTITAEELETMRVNSAVRTDFILSAEIMAITYATIIDKPFVFQIIVMIAVAVAITIAVYGFVALIVKMDDIGLHMAKETHKDLTQKIGRGIVKIMPDFLKILSYVGTAAMLWVGAEIIAHGVPILHHGLEFVSGTLSFSPFIAWVAKASLCALGGIAIGFVIDIFVCFVKRATNRNQTL